MQRNKQKLLDFFCEYLFDDEQYQIHYAAISIVYTICLEVVC